MSLVKKTITYSHEEEDPNFLVRELPKERLKHKFIFLTENGGEITEFKKGKWLHRKWYTNPKVIGNHGSWWQWGDSERLNRKTGETEKTPLTLAYEYYFDRICDFCGFYGEHGPTKYKDL